MAFEYFQFPYGSDNYAVLVHDPASGATACVDAGDASAVLSALESTGWTLSELWITHHHGDHTAGLAEVKAATGAKVLGPEGIAGVDQVLKGGDSFTFAGQSVELLHTPGHTLDMLNFHIPSQAVVFTGDTLFVMGCGRVFEGTPDMMWESLQKLMALPPETTIYCSHEYTAANAKFALSIDGSNAALQARAAEITALRAKGEPTVPTRLSTELETNPFLRPMDPTIRQTLNMTAASDAEVFAEIRHRKDVF
ncbi:MAG: hydroxyacylglutathione hydrolase [Paracoccaceae bacterium]